MHSCMRSCRIHLQSVSYGHARHLEAIGDYKGAIQHYIDSGTAATEVRQSDLLTHKTVKGNFFSFPEMHPASYSIE